LPIVASFANRRVLVTGASRGGGAAIAKAFARAGAHTVVLSARNGPALEKIKADIQAMGGARRQFLQTYPLEKRAESWRPSVAKSTSSSITQPLLPVRIRMCWSVTTHSGI